MVKIGKIENSETMTKKIVCKYNTLLCVLVDPIHYIHIKLMSTTGSLRDF